jgi:type IV pilus assembly protein PilN
MIRINLLPHREIRREQRKRDFIGVCVITAVAAVIGAFLVGTVINQQISTQDQRNTFVTVANRKLDAEIKEIATLREEIEALRARQEAVETLQSNRTMPVHVLDEIARDTPEGVLLKAIKQDDQRLVITGWAQSNDRISEMLRNLSAPGHWLERPELLEIRATTINGTAGPGAGGAAAGSQTPAREARSVFEFGVSVLVKSPKARSNPGKPGPADASGGPAAPRG